jgi:hypothetical protein
MGYLPRSTFQPGLNPEPRIPDIVGCKAGTCSAPTSSVICTLSLPIEGKKKRDSYPEPQIPGESASHQTSHLRLLASAPDRVHRRLVERDQELETLGKSPVLDSLKIVAEREGFEPSMQLNTTYTISNRAPSTARPPLHVFNF